MPNDVDWGDLHNSLTDSLTSPEFMGQHPFLPSAADTDQDTFNSGIQRFSQNVGDAYESAMAKAGVPADLAKQHRQGFEQDAIKKASAFSVNRINESKRDKLTEQFRGYALHPEVLGEATQISPRNPDIEISHLPKDMQRKSFWGGDQEASDYAQGMANAYAEVMKKQGLDDKSLDSRKEQLQNDILQGMRQWRVGQEGQYLGGKPGTLSDATWWARHTPFASFGADYVHNKQVGAALKRWESGQATRSDYHLLARERQSQTNQQNEGWGASIGKSAVGLGSFAAEMAALSPLSALGQAAGGSLSAAAKSPSWLQKASPFIGAAAARALPESALGEGMQALTMPSKKEVAEAEQQTGVHGHYQPGQATVNAVFDNAMIEGTGMFRFREPGTLRQTAMTAVKKAVFNIAGMNVNDEVKGLINERSIDPHSPISQAINEARKGQFDGPGMKSLAAQVVTMGAFEAVMSTHGYYRGNGEKAPSQDKVQKTILENLPQQPTEQGPTPAPEAAQTTAQEQKQPGVEVPADTAAAREGKRGGAHIHPAQAEVPGLAGDWQAGGDAHWKTYPEEKATPTDAQITDESGRDPLPDPEGMQPTVKRAWDLVSRLWPEMAGKIQKIEVRDFGQQKARAGVTRDGMLYVPAGQEVTPETLWHELVHMEQWNEGRLPRNRTRDQHIEVEREAYSRAAQMVRDGGGDVFGRLAEAIKAKQAPVPPVAEKPIETPAQQQQEPSASEEPRSATPAAKSESKADEIRRRVLGGENVSTGEIFDAAGLSPQERHIVLERMSGRTHEDIGKDPELTAYKRRKGKGQPYTRSRVEQMEAEALQKLRQFNPDLPDNFSLAGVISEESEALKGEAREATKQTTPEDIGRGRMTSEERAAVKRAKKPLDAAEQVQAHIKALAQEMADAGEDVSDEQLEHFRNESERLENALIEARRQQQRGAGKQAPVRPPAGRQLQGGNAPPRAPTAAEEAAGRPEPSKGAPGVPETAGNELKSKVLPDTPTPEDVLFAVGSNTQSVAYPPDAKKDASGSIRQYNAEEVARADRDAKAMARGERYFQRHIEAQDKPTKKKRWLEFWLPIETGQMDAMLKDQRPFGDAYVRLKRGPGGYLDELVSRGLTQDEIDDHVGHLYSNPNNPNQSGKDILQAIRSRRPLAGQEGFRKQRRVDIPTWEEALDAGFEPKSWNPMEQARLEFDQLSKSIMAHDIRDDLQDQGLRQFFRPGQRPPSGWVQGEDRADTVHAPASAVPGAFGPILAGNYYYPEPVARILKNFMSPGLASSPGLGGASYRAFRGFGNQMSQALLGLSGFHGTMTTMTAQATAMEQALTGASQGNFWGALKKLPEAIVPGAADILGVRHGLKLRAEWANPGSQSPEIQEQVQMLKEAGARARGGNEFVGQQAEKMMRNLRIASESLKQGNFLQAGRNTAVAAARLLPALNQAFSKPTMEWLVPLVKMHAAVEGMAQEMWKNPNMTPEQRRDKFGQIWDQMDDRFGLLTYDNLFLPRIARDLLQSTFLSAGWNIGDARVYLGAAKDAASPSMYKSLLSGEGVSRRVGFLVGMFGTAAMYGALYQYLKTGKRPESMKDYIFPQDGTVGPDGVPGRKNIPGYAKDGALLIRGADQGPMQIPSNIAEMVKGKLHPAYRTAWELLENRDWRDNPIYDTNDTWAKQARADITHLTKSIMPISIQQGMKASQEGEGTGGQVESAFGITKAPYKITHTPEQEAKDPSRVMALVAQAEQRESAQERKEGVKYRQPTYLREMQRVKGEINDYERQYNIPGKTDQQKKDIRARQVARAEVFSRYYAKYLNEIKGRDDQVQAKKSLLGAR